MMRWIVGASMQLRVLVVVVAALVMVFGVSKLRQMPVDVLPEFSQPYVEIQTESLGLSAEEVEQLITVPMEQDLLVGLPWLKSIQSESVPGLSSVVLTFQPGTDLMRAKRDSQAILAFRTALTFDSAHVSSYINLATIANRQKRFDDALAHYARANRVDSTALFRNNLNHEWGSTLVLLGRYAEAESAFRRMAPNLSPEMLVVSCTKGLEDGTLLRMSEVIADALRSHHLTPRVGVLSGPSFAKEVARGDPTAVTVASTDSP